MYKLLLFILGFIFKGPINTVGVGQKEDPKCSSSCALTGIQKMSYFPSKTYIYEYKGRTSVALDGYASVVTWYSIIEFTWIGPCDVIVYLNNTTIKNAKDRYLLEALTRYPLVVAMSKGSIDKICFHPEEEERALNFKKGLLSAFQNTLPSLSLSHSGQTFYEIGTSGICPTHYEVESTASKFIITKLNDYKHCLNSTYDGVPSKLFRKLLSRVRNCKCVQEISSGIFTKVVCKDVNEFAVIPFRTAKSLSYEHLSEFIFLNESQKVLQFEYNISTFKSSTLTIHSFDYATQNTDNLHLKVMEILHEMCTFRTAISISNLIELLNKCKPEYLVTIFRRIQNRTVCPQGSQLESIFLDIIPYVKNEASVKIMVEQLLSNRVNSFRKGIYLVSMLTSKASKRTIEHLIPIFTYPSISPQPLKLAAGTLIRKYCLRNAKCIDFSPLQTIFRELAKDLYHSCSYKSSNASFPMDVLGTLKSIGNIGVTNLQLQSGIFDCISSPDIDSLIRVAAIETFRNHICSNKITKKLLGVLSNARDDAEIRIAAYLEVMRCTPLDTEGIPTNIQEVLSIMKKESDFNVKSFVTSHLRELCNATYPRPNAKLKENLTKLLHPESTNNASSYSYSKRYSYFSEYFGIGGNLNLNSRKFYHKNTTQRDVKLSFGDYINISDLFELSFREETDESTQKFLQFIFSKDQHNLNEMPTKILTLLAKALNLKIATDAKLNFLDDFKLDAYLRILGNECIFISLSKNAFQHLNFSLQDRLIYFSIFKDKEATKELFKNINLTSVFHTDFDFFVSNTNGIPIIMKFDSTLIFGLKVSDNLHQSDCFSLIPEFSSSTRLFLGFDLGSDLGILVDSKIELSNDLKIHLMPNKFEMKITVEVPTQSSIIFSSSNAIYLKNDLINKFNNSPPVLVHSDTFNKKRCLVSRFCFPGLKCCWKFHTRASNQSVLEGTFAKFNASLEKVDPAMKNIELKTSWKLNLNNFSLDGDITTSHGSKSFDHGKLKLLVINKKSYFSLLTQINANGIRKGFQISLEETSTKRGFRKDLSIFISNSDIITSNDKILGIKFINGNEDKTTTYDIQLQTINNLKAIIKVNFEVEFKYSSHVQLETESEVAVPTKEGRKSRHFLESRLLGKLLKDAIFHPLENKSLFQNSSFRRMSFNNLDFELDSGSLRIVVSIQRVASEKGISEYRFSSHFKGENHEASSAKGDVAFSGLPKGRNYLITSNIFLYSDGKECRINAEVLHNERQVKYQLLAENLLNGESLVVLKYQKERKSFNAVNIVTDAEVWFRGYTSHYQMDGVVVETEKGTYYTDFTFKRDEEEMFCFEGPIAIHEASDSTKELLALKISSVKGGPYEIKVGYDFSNLRSKAFLSIRNRSAQIVYLRGELKRFLPDEECYCYSGEIQFQRMISITFEGEATQKSCSKYSLVTIFADTPFKKTLKTSCHIDYVRKFIEAKLQFNLDQLSTYDKVKITTQYDFITHFISLKGSVELSSGDYSYTIEVDKWQHLLVDIRKPFKNRFLLEIFYSKNVRKEQQAKISAGFHILTFGGREFRWSNILDFDLGATPVLANGKICIQASRIISNFSLEIESALIATQHQTNFSSKLLAIIPNGSIFIEGNAQCCLDPRNKTSGYNIFAPQKTASLKITGFHKIGETVGNMTVQLYGNSGKRFSLWLEKNGRHVIGFKLDMESWNSSLLEVITTSKHIVVKFQGHFEQLLSTFNPRPQWHIFAEEDRNKLNVKSLFRREKIDLKTIRGHIEVSGLFPKSEVITVSIESLQFYDGSKKTELIFTSPHFDSSPRILLETSFASSTTSLTFTFRHSSTVPAVFSCGCSYAITSWDQTTFYMYIRSQWNNFEFSGNSFKCCISEVDSPDQSSLTVQGSIRTSTTDEGMSSLRLHFSSNNYLFNIALEVAQNQKLSHYHSNLGWQKQHFFFIIQRVQNSEELQNLMKVALRFSAPSIHVIYNRSEMDKLSLLVRDFVWKTSEVAEKISVEARQEFASIWQQEWNRSSIYHLIELIHNELTFYEDFQSLEFSASFSTLEEEIWTLWLDGFETSTKLAKGVRQWLSIYLFQLSETVIKEYGPINKFITDSLRQFGEAVNSFWTSIRELTAELNLWTWILSVFKSTDVWKWGVTKWREFYATFKQETDILIEASHQLQRIWRFSGSHDGIQNLEAQFHDWLKLNFLDFLLETWKGIFAFRVDNNVGEILVKAPLPLKLSFIQDTLFRLPETLANRPSLLDAWKALLNKVYVSEVPQTISTTVVNGEDN